MKAITVRQPFAWAIIHGGKDIENRDWRTHYRGPLLIHAAGTMTAKEYGAYAEALAKKKRGPMPQLDELKFGGVIGMVDLVEVVESHDSPWFGGPFGFVLRSPRALPFLETPGQVKLFEIEWEPKTS